MLNIRRTSRREKCCRGCFAYIRYSARKCQFCGHKYKPSGKSLFDKIKQVFLVDRVHKVERAIDGGTYQMLFTSQEIEFMLKSENYRIKMFLVLDDLTNLDETALVALGETLSLIG